MKKGHEDQEAHEAKHRMRLPSPLSEETEQIITRIIGAAIAVHRQLGPGFLESLYRHALSLELSARGLTYECERGIRVCYRNRELPIHGSI